MRSKKRLALIAFVLAVAVTELGNRTASIPLSRVSAPGWMVAGLFWPAGIHEGTSSAAVGSIVVAFVVNVTLWTLLLYALARLVFASGRNGAGSDDRVPNSTR